MEETGCNKAANTQLLILLFMSGNLNEVVEASTRKEILT